MAAPTRKGAVLKESASARAALCPTLATTLCRIGVRTNVHARQPCRRSFTKVDAGTGAVSAHAGAWRRDYDLPGLVHR
jgi:hypothetical protein